GQRGRQIEAAFHGFNIAAQADTTEAIILPSAEAFVESFGLHRADPRTASVTAAISGIIAGKATGAPRWAGGGTKVVVTEGTFPDEVFTGKKPHQTTPGIGSVTQERYNPATGKLEESVIEYDQYGRQVKRTDYINHGYGNQEKPTEYHSDPHTHIYEYGPGYGSNGKETRIDND
ncbi:hypothetical protein V2K57_24135, partial [Pseudomonas alliivorans]|nr:hypothetical protein [Pseudomonas alliivorans]MEE4703436.1 hypothetical protein [Pseudomonas alliivorans]MEE4739484.1 hypothetical protein [Pseudomonas alliivorans]MEE5115095.1 hypothetical protein [Pseudomonas alliivorans]